MIMRTFNNAFLLMLGMLVLGSAKAQIDPHFSQYYVYPSFLNPALTGAFDGNYRVSGIYRNQWNSVSAPFSTPGLSADFNTGKKLNFGFSLMNQQAGDGGYNYVTGYGSLAFTGIRFGEEGRHRVVFGMQAGVINRRFNTSKLTFSDQWNPVTGTLGQTAEVFSKTSSMAFDAGAGVLYYDAKPGKKVNFYGGFSASHLTRPDDDFSAYGNTNEKVPVRWIGHAGVKIMLSQSFSITPNILYMRQRTAEEKMVGAYAQMRITEGSDFMFGANYRYKDAVAPYVGYTYKGMVLAASYDVNVSDLGKMQRGVNGFEISLSFIGGRKHPDTSEKEFVCPRL
jgi:type IX secretion system PorP/SprF family membrane protein